MWDRSLSEYAYDCSRTKGCKIPKRLSKYDKIFVGHTTTQRYNTTLPLKLCNLWMLDTGAGWNEKITIMDIDTEEYWQSDRSIDLYGANQGR
jgi:serine/threonine protein phosphatase 1